MELPVRKNTRSISRPNDRVRMNYLGVLALLGRVARDLPRGHHEHYGVDKAMRDANNYLLLDDSDLIFLPSSGGGYAAFARGAMRREDVARLFSERSKDRSKA
jgi:hypothetical protein